jgi:transcriptional regulator with XRE-family HTH domain
MRQNELAARIGVSPEEMSAVECERIVPTAVVLREASRIFDMPLFDLQYGTLVVRCLTEVEENDIMERGETCE